MRFPIPPAFPLKVRLLLAALPLAVAAGCGGGDSPAWGTAPGTTASSGNEIVYISGTVAAGAAVIGSIEVKDVKGARKQLQIAADGSYKLGLKGLTLPLLLRATGYAGGNAVVLLSAATVEDAGKTVNITPFTDLIVANAAGGGAESFFDAPDFSRISPANLDQARAMVTQRIASVMSELGVAADFDLRRSPFQADHSRFDAVLDVIHVAVDAVAAQATISDVINQRQVVDDLRNMQDAAALPAPPAGSYASAVSELIAIDAVLGKLNALFASSVPAATDPQLLALFDSDFLYNGLNLAAFLSDTQLLSSSNIGVKLINPVIASRSADGKTMRVRVQVLDTLGKVIAYDQVDSDEMAFRKDASGNWRMAGDRRMGDASVTSVNRRHMQDGTPFYSRAVAFRVPSANAQVKYVSFSGPGLPAAAAISGLGTVSGVLLRRAGAGGAFSVLDSNARALDSQWLNECPSLNPAIPCIDIGSIPADAGYAVTFFDAAMARLGEVTTVSLALPPAPLAEAQQNAAKWFPAFGPFAPAAFGALSDGAAVGLSWSKPASAAYTAVEAGLLSGAIGFSKPLGSGDTSAVIGNWRGGAPALAPYAWIYAAGPHDREFVISSRYPQ